MADDPLDAIPPGCTECGSVIPGVEKLKGAVRHLREQLDLKQFAVDDLLGQLRRERAINGKLLADRDGQEKADPLYPDAKLVYDYWKDQIAPTSREFTGERFRAVRARLEAGHTVEGLKRAVDGAKAHPRPGSKGVTDLKSICRNEENLLMFLGFAGVKISAEPVLAQPYLPKTPARTNGWHPRSRHELVEAIRGRILLYELEESPSRAATLLAEIHEFSHA